MANWWDRFAYAAKSYVGRLAQETGVVDVIDELSRFDDEEFTLSNSGAWITNAVDTALGSTFQGLTMPFQTLATPAIELNRFAGTVARGAVAAAPGGLQAGSPWADYFTGGISAEERDRMLNETAPNVQKKTLQEVATEYSPITGTDALVIGMDKVRNRYGPAAYYLASAIGPQAIVTAPAVIGGLLNSQKGVQSNGSYLPREWDMFAQDSGTQVWEMSNMGPQLIGGQIAGEMALDPLTYFTGPLTAPLKAISSAKLVPGALPDAARVAESIDKIGNVVAESTWAKRAAQNVPGKGSWTPDRFIEEVGTNPRLQETFIQVAGEKRVNVLRSWLVDEGLATGEGADTLSVLFGHLEDPKDIARLWYAASYRDGEALRGVLNTMEGQVDGLGAANRLRVMTGTGDNVLEEAMVQFGNGDLPDGHLLTSDSSRSFINDAIDAFDARAGLAKDDPNSIRTQWQALAEGSVDAEIAELDKYRKAMESAEKLLGTEVDAAGERLLRLDQVIERAPRKGAKSLAKAGELTSTGRVTNGVRAVAQLLDHYVSPHLRVPGSPMKLSPDVWLVGKPGLTFSLHGLDAVEKFDGIARYVDGIAGGRFASDPEVLALRQRFIEAGATNRAPEQVRGGLVNELQTLAIARIAARRGATTDAAMVFAEAGMAKAQKFADAMNDVQKGYVSNLEDGRAQSMIGHPATPRQGANHIPIMNLKAVDDALASKGARNAITHTGDLLSQAQAKNFLDTALREVGPGAKESGKEGARAVRLAGRGLPTRATHHMTDVMDDVNTIFKMFVLSRVGYGVRNVAEAHLSAHAGGVGWLNVIANADIGGLMANTATNWRNFGTRRIDRIQTYRGVIYNEDALRIIGQATHQGIVLSEDTLHRMVAAITDPAELKALARKAGDDADPDQAWALAQVETIIRYRAQAATAVQKDLIDRGLVDRADPAFAEEADIVGNYHHADRTGNLDPNEDVLRALKGPISVTEDGAAAQRMVDDAWQELPSWSNHVHTPGSVKGPARIEASAFTKKQREVLAGTPPVPAQAVPDTRGQQIFYHGTSQRILGGPEADRYATMNIFGQGLYTTDDLTTAISYTKKGKGKEPAVHKISPAEDVKFYDLEGSVGDEVREWLEEIQGSSDTAADMLADLEHFATPRAVINEFRARSAGNGESADTVQEWFQALRERLEGEGYGGFSHLGGVTAKAGGRKHNVRIWWEPNRQLGLEDVDLGAYQAQPGAPAASGTGWKVQKNGSVAISSAAGWDNFITYMDTAVSTAQADVATASTALKNAKKAPPLTLTQEQQWWFSRSGNAGPVGTPEQIAANNLGRGPGPNAARQQVAENAAPGTHIWRGEVRSDPFAGGGTVGRHWTVDPNAVIQLSDSQMRSGEHNVIWHGVLQGDESRVPAYGLGNKKSAIPLDAEVRFADDSDIHLLGVSIDGTYYPLTQTAKVGAAPAPVPGAVAPAPAPFPGAKSPLQVGTVPGTDPVQIADAALKAARSQHRALVGTRATMTDVIKWHATQRGLAKMKGHHVEWRQDASSPWVAWNGPQTYKRGNKPEIGYRVVDKAGSETKPKAMPVQVWGGHIDLTDATTVSRVEASYKNGAVVRRALAGDRDAQNRLSEVFAAEGFTRTTFPDAVEWGGKHTLLHPTGIGERAYRNQVQRVVQHLVEQNRTAPLRDDYIFDTLSKGQRKLANKGALEPEMVPQTEVAEKAYAAEKVLLNEEAKTPSALSIKQQGGIEALLDDMVETHANLLNQQKSINAAYHARQQHVANIEKRRGIRAQEWRFTGAATGSTYRTWDALHGENGGAYAQLASGNLNQVLTYSASAHHADMLSDMSRATMRPEALHPGDSRYFEGLANLMNRHFSDKEGVLLPDGSTSQRMIDPIMRWAMQEGDYEENITRAVDWVLHSADGRQWMKSLNLAPAKNVEDAIRLADKARAKRALPPVTAKESRELTETSWHQTTNEEIFLPEVEVADMIRAHFNFAENWLPNQKVRDAYLEGRLTSDVIREAYDEAPWELHPYTGLVSPSHAEFRRAAKQRRQNERNMNRVTGLLTPILRGVLEKVGSGPETRLARHPVFNAIAKTDLQQRINFAEFANEGRPLSEAQVLSLRSASQKYALKKMEQTLYTLRDRSAVDEFMRFVFPFFPAWRNAAHRWGKMATENPVQIAQLGRAYTTLVDGMPWYDFNGNETDVDDPEGAYRLMPSLTRSVMGMLFNDPTTDATLRRTRVSARTLDVIFQGDILNPGMGPMVGAPAQLIADHFAETTNHPFIKGMLKYIMPVGPVKTGSGVLNFVSAFLPSAAREALAAELNTENHQSTVNRIGATYLANGFDYDNGVPKPPEQVNAEINNAAMHMTALKIFRFFVSPFASSDVGDFEYYAGQYRSLRDTYPTGNDADYEFLDRFGGESWFYKESSTANLTGGGSTAQVVANQKKYQDLAFEATSVFDDPKMLGFFENLGVDGETMAYDSDAYSPFARNWQMTNAPGTSEQPYRGTKGGEQAQDSAEVSLGWKYFDYGMAQVEQKLIGDGAIVGSPDFLKRKATMEDAVASEVAARIPGWAEARERVDVGKTEDRADFFRWAVTSSSWARDNGSLAIARSIREYLDAREQVRAEIGRRVAADPNWGKTTDALNNADLKMYLEGYGQQLASGSLTFDGWKKQFFRTDRVGLE